MKLAEKNMTVSKPKTQVGIGNSFYRTVNGPKPRYRLVRFSDENLKAEKTKHIEHKMNGGFLSYSFSEIVYMYYPDAAPPPPGTRTPPHVRLVPESRLPYSGDMMKVSVKEKIPSTLEATDKSGFLILETDGHSIIYKGEGYELTINQFKIIQYLYEKSKTKFPSVRTARMLEELEIGTDRLPKIFYSQKYIFEALIIKGNRKGTVKLKLD